MTTQIVTNQELEQAQLKLAAVKEKAAAALMEKTAAEIVAFRNQEEARLLRMQRERERLETEHARRKKEQAEAEGRVRKEHEAHERELERQHAIAESALREQERRETEYRHIQEETFLLEQELRRQESDKYAANKTEEADSTPIVTDNGRSALFGRLANPTGRYDGLDGHSDENK
jgi:hypothetical protein